LADFKNFKKWKNVVGRDTRKSRKRKSHLPLGGVNAERKMAVIKKTREKNGGN
jgi:hypothetical protein